MDIGSGSGRFMETTRGQLVTLLRRGPRPVDELARSLGLTDNAVRAHLIALERDGIVRQHGTRRGTGAGKPATLFELRPEGEALLSRAYAPVLRELLEELATQLPPDRIESILQGLGRRLATDFIPPPGATAELRVEAAANVLQALGGLIELDREAGSTVIRGFGCPLAVAIERRPEACVAVQTLLAEVSGATVRQCCRHGPRPSCCFEIPTATLPVLDAERSSGQKETNVQ
jgi:predicted ArsR family transcriptional regulator